jgi:hypothetical protein
MITNQEELNIRGGSIRFELSQFQDNKKYIDDAILFERFIGPEDFKNLQSFLALSRDCLKNRLQRETEQGNKVYGYGASHSTGTLVHYFELEEYIDELVDENILKQSKYMPGTKLQVKDPGIIYDKNEHDDAVVVILAWQYFDQIAQKLRDNGFRGNIIKPILP